MEQKKILLVVISVGVFLVIAVGAAILVFGNDNTSGNILAARPVPAGTSGNYAVPETTFPNERPPVSSENTAEQAEDTVPGFIENPVSPDTAPAAGNEDPLAAENAVGSGEDEGIAGTAGTGSEGGNTDSPSTTISVSRPSTAAVPDVPPVTRQPSPPRPAASLPPVTPAAPVPAASVKPTPRTYNDFWVQTGSFSTVSRAENVKDTLSAKGIVSIIENRIIGDATYYRVRVGPYTSQNEADYWLSRIKSIDGFEDSQIWQSPSTR